MRYVEFKSVVVRELRRNRKGLTWAQLRERLDLPYRTPCPEWVRRMEVEEGLTRKRGDGRAYVWKVASGK